MKRVWMTSMREAMGASLQEMAKRASSNDMHVQVSVLVDLESSESAYTGRSFAHTIAEAYGMSNEQEQRIGVDVKLPKDCILTKAGKDPKVVISVPMVKWAIETSGMSRRDLCLRAGRDPSYADAILSELKRRPLKSMECARRIAEMLQVPVEKIIIRG